MKQVLSKYFNQRTKIEAGTALSAGASSIILAATFNPIALGCAAVCGVVAAGYANKWREKVSGKPFWKPVTGIFYGL